VSKSCPDCGAEIYQGKACCPKCGYNLVSPKDGSSQEQQSGDPISELDRAEPDQTSATAPALKAAEQQADPVPPQEPSLENNSSHKTLSLLAYTAGGALGVALALFFAGVLPLAMLMLSTVGLAMKILWVLAAGLLLVLTMFVLIRMEPAATSGAHPEGPASREPPTKEASAHSAPPPSVQRPNGHK
jgi:uncharacterized Zn finger protein (UPF0148 family)